jgi:nitrogen-specific signal transduction histidine kinase
LNILEKVISVTCDGAKNRVNAFDSFDPSIQRLWCVAHKIHLVVCNGLEMLKNSKAISSQRDSTDELSQTIRKMVIDADDLDDDSDGDEERDFIRR